jgi:hypothetical protein
MLHIHNPHGNRRRRGTGRPCRDYPTSPGLLHGVGVGRHPGRHIRIYRHRPADFEAQLRRLAEVGLWHYGANCRAGNGCSKSVRAKTSAAHGRAPRCGGAFRPRCQVFRSGQPRTSSGRPPDRPGRLVGGQSDRRERPNVEVLIAQTPLETRCTGSWDRKPTPGCQI